MTQLLFAKLNSKLYFNLNFNWVEFSITFILSDHSPTTHPPSSWTKTLSTTSTPNVDYNFIFNLSLAQLSPSLLLVNIINNYSH